MAGALQTAEDGALREEIWGGGEEQTNWGTLAQGRVEGWLSSPDRLAGRK